MPINDFWYKTGRTFLCHLNVQYKKVPDTLVNHHETLEFLSNLTPGSVQYNQTVRKLRRNKRLIDNRQYFHKQINSKTMSTDAKPILDENLNEYNGSSADAPSLISGSPGFPETVNTTIKHSHNKLNVTHQQSQHEFEHLLRQQLSNNTAASPNAYRKINTEKYWKKYKNYKKYKHSKNLVLNTHNQTPVKMAELILNTSDDTDDMCLPLSKYALLFSGVYILFTISAFQFLFFTQSAVFTVAVMSTALPVAGIFWSMFELTTQSNIGKYTFFANNL